MTPGYWGTIWGAHYWRAGYWREGAATNVGVVNTHLLKNDHPFVPRFRNKERLAG